MPVKRTDFKRIGAGQYKGPDGKTYNIGSGSLDALVEKLNKGGGTTKDKKPKDKSVITPQDRATGQEFEDKYRSTVDAPEKIVDTYEPRINDLIATGGSTINAATPEQVTALNNLTTGLQGGFTDPLEQQANEYLAQVMNQGMTQEEFDAAQSVGANTINRNLQGVLRSAMGNAGGQGLNRGSAISNSLGGINEAGGLLQELARKLVMDNMKRKDDAGVNLGNQVNNQLARRNTASNQAAGIFGDISNNIGTNRVNLFNTMVNGLVSQQATNLNVQSTNIANKGAQQLGLYGAYMGGMSTAEARAEAKRARALQEKQINLASRGFSSNSGGGGSTQTGVNNTPSFPDPGTGTPATQGKSAGGF
jgi:hypothetical protein